MAESSNVISQGSTVDRQGSMFAHRLYRELMADAHQGRVEAPAMQQWPSPGGQYNSNCKTAGYPAAAAAGDEDISEDLAASIQQAVAAYLQDGPAEDGEDEKKEAAEDEALDKTERKDRAFNNLFGTTQLFATVPAPPAAPQAWPAGQVLPNAGPWPHSSFGWGAEGTGSVPESLQAHWEEPWREPSVNAEQTASPVAVYSQEHDAGWTGSEEAKVEVQEPKKSRGRNRGGDGSRYWCSFHLTEAYLKHHVVPAIIGKNGTNTRSIFEATGAKIRVRGRGSGHKEMSTGKEAPAGLMVTVSANADNLTGFNDAVRMTGVLLDRIEAKMHVKVKEAKEPLLGDLCWHVISYNGQCYHLEHGELVAEERANRRPQGINDTGLGSQLTPSSRRQVKGRQPNPTNQRSRPAEPQCVPPGLQGIYPQQPPLSAG
eukprot:TRINITY_DN2931_c0_g1_i4.p1 TRINITY_DN2931_c0_g1~~TRINITY_DN2931_c0_g1_i4.p1  ORF type:complete len:429 (-),score=79.81 TRINITY_DN2931_c0_g1_i4:100-1386(-)